MDVGETVEELDVAAAGQAQSKDAAAVLGAVVEEADAVNADVLVVAAAGKPIADDGAAVLGAVVEGTGAV